MRKVSKPEGIRSLVTVTNTDTFSSITISRLTQNIIDILKEGGVTIPTELEEPWDIEIDKDTATKLVALTTRMKKPIRNQSKKTETVAPQQVEISNEDIDAFDLIFGL